MSKFHNYSFLGKTLPAFTSSMASSVVIQDAVYPVSKGKENTELVPNRFCALAASSSYVPKHLLEAKELLIGTIINGIFFEDNIEVKIDIIRKEAEAEEKLLKAQSELKKDFVYVEEVICGGKAAKGGGCGTILELEEVYKTYFDLLPGAINTDFVQHTDAEAGKKLCLIRDDGYLRLKLMQRPCHSCAKHF